MKTFQKAAKETEVRSKFAQLLGFGPFFTSYSATKFNCM